jgi:hypothetical protein
MPPQYNKHNFDDPVLFYFYVFHMNWETQYNMYVLLHNMLYLHINHAVA